MNMNIEANKLHHHLFFLLKSKKITFRERERGRGGGGGGGGEGGGGGRREFAKDFYKEKKLSHSFCSGHL